MKTEQTLTVDGYIQQFSESTQEILQQIRQLIKEVVPEATEKMSYQMPTYYYKENLVHFAAYEKHIGFYPAPSGIAAFEKELKAYKHAKGSVQFPLDKPIPFELIRRITSYRLEEIQQKSKR